MILPIALEFASIALEFQPEDSDLAGLVRLAASISPAVAPSNERVPKLRVRLTRGQAPSWSVDAEGLGVAACSPDGLSFVPVLRAAMCQALAPEGALVHAAGAVLDGEGLLFVAPSGGGKTTLSNLIADEATLLSDETVCVRPDPVRPGHYAIYGTCFWSGPAHPGRAGAFPLAALCFLRKGPLELRPLQRLAALPELLREIHLPLTLDATTNSLAVATRLLQRTPAFSLQFPLAVSPISELRTTLRGFAR